MNRRSQLKAILFVATLFHCAENFALAEGSKNHDYSARDALIYKPRIDYPYEARRRRITGCGGIIVEVNPANGAVTKVHMGPSTGAPILDRAAIDAFQKARFRPGSHRMFKIPICFTLSGQVITEFRVKQKSMDEVLTHFLGKGTVLSGPIPAYPRIPPWTFREGKGVYELHVGKDGRVGQVKILKTSGDATFDHVAVETLRKWRLSRGPIILGLPLHFTLTPLKYSVEIPKD